MSEESAKSPEPAGSASVGGAAAPKRAVKTRPRKKAKATKTAKVAESAPEKAAKFPEFSQSPETPETSDAPATATDWPEPEAPSAGASASPDGPKRKRRRKKGKGAGTPGVSATAEGGNPPETKEAPPVQAPRQNPQPRTKLDPELLAKFAWKIYLAEISEEGVALVGDTDAKELTRRCFRLAEIFLEEQARRR